MKHPWKAQLTPQHDLASEWIERIYESFDGNEAIERYHTGHGVDSLCILTVASYGAAVAEVDKFKARIAGKTVVEIGAGVGLLALEMARHAKHVFAIEADPHWSWVFGNCLYSLKPPNLTWIFGRAQDMIGLLHADIAVVFTRSDVKGMAAIASRMAPEVIRGPLVEFKERYEQQMTPEMLQYAQDLATSAMVDDALDGTFGRKGLTGARLRRIQEEFLKRFPEAAIV